MVKTHKKTGRPSLGKGPVYETRTRLGISQIEMASRLGLSVRTVKTCEKNGTLPQSAASRKILEGM